MGGKGKKRREKNYEAAHGGGHTRLPPPPDPNSLDKTPSKLKKLMSFSGGVATKKKSFTDSGMERTRENSTVGKDETSSGFKRKRDDQIEMAENKGHGSASDKKKRRNKRKKAEDLRFVTADEMVPAATKRKERRKQRLEAKKKKKGKPSNSEEEKGFLGHENIKFGDVVQAPPKLNTAPKSFKTTQDASQERLRLQAVEAYRKRKGWMARPGFQLSAPVTTSPFA